VKLEGHRAELEARIHWGLYPHQLPLVQEEVDHALEATRAPIGEVAAKSCFAAFL
jgi:hypothetical protein